MKLLLDESVPIGLATSFPPDTFEIKTVVEMGWSGIENGELLRFAAYAGFEALITVDKNIEHQQNLNSLPLAVIVLSASSSKIHSLRPMIPEVISVLEDDLGRNFIKVQVPSRDTVDSNKEKKP